MHLDPTNAYVTTVSAGHTITLPDDIPVGARVAVVVLPEAPPAVDDADRPARFAATLKAIRAAAGWTPDTGIPDDAALDRLIAAARRGMSDAHHA